MKQGVRALGVAESYRGETSTLAGAVVRASRVVDGVTFADCTVGGRDATTAVCRLWDRLDREDVRYVLLAGIAPAWYNLLDPATVADHTDRPVLAVTFEAGGDLREAIRSEFDGEAAAARLSTYESLPEPRETTVGGERLFYRPVGVDDEEAEDVLAAFTPEGGRPEPLRVARLAARGADAWQRESRQG
jgi:endonuclease V-like protein UPF0215 family